MDKQERKLIWKYFWQQKKQEVLDFFGTNGYVFIAFSVVTGLIFQIGWIVEEAGQGPIAPKLAIIGLVILGIWVLVVLILAIRELVNWLKKNWKEAKDRVAREKLNKEVKNEN